MLTEMVSNCLLAPRTCGAFASFLRCQPANCRQRRVAGESGTEARLTLATGTRQSLVTSGVQASSHTECPLTGSIDRAEAMNAAMLIGGCSAAEANEDVRGREEYCDDDAFFRICHARVRARERARQESCDSLSYGNTPSPAGEGDFRSL